MTDQVLVVFNNIFAIKAHAGGAVRSWFNFKHNVEARVAEISIDDEIGGWGISARRLVDQIKSLGEKDRIKLHIYSPGGDVLEANEIYNALADHKGGVDVEIGALCASAATIIACAGDTITMKENGFFMIHNPWTVAYGDADEFGRVAAVLAKFKANIIAAYTARTGLEEGKLSKLMDDESWMTAAEALENKFINSIDKLKEGEEAEDPQDRFDLSAFKNSVSAFSRLPKKARQQTSQVSLNAPPPASPGKSTQKQTSNQPRKPSLASLYMNNQLRIFNGPLQGSIAIALAASQAAGLTSGNVTETGQKLKIRNDPPAPGDETPEQRQLAITNSARELYQAKLRRDKEIDDIVLAVRKRDKKDFSELAGEFKTQDKTPDEFARAITSSDKFKNIGEAIGSGIEVLGVVGLDQGTPGELFVSSEEYRALIDGHAKGGGKRANSLSVQTRGFLGAAMARFLNTTSSTGLTSIEKLPGVVTLGVRPLMVKDLIAPGATNNTTIRYIQEQSFTNAATTVAEGATKPAASFSLAEVDSPVRKIAAYTKVTDELFMDFLAVASYINMRLPYMVERTEEDQLLNGDGTGNNLTGILTTAGIQTQAVSADTAIDAIYKAFTKVRWGNLAGTALGGFEPDATILHPTDWEAIRLSKDQNLQYYGGGPFTGAYGNGQPSSFEMLWGKPVVVTPAIAQGTALVGAFRLASQYFQRQGLTIQSTNTDQDDFIKNLTTIRAEVRLALAVYRPLAFAQVTGL